MSVEISNELGRGFHKLAIKASGWVLFGHFWSQFFRFAGNLILTRLLVPSDFGLMQLVAVFMQGVSMMSDLGLSLNIIQHKKGEDTGFLRTAWTIQILRGLLIALILVLIAYPIATLYQAPALMWLIPLASINSIIEGFTSMNLAVYNRKMKMSKLTFLDLGSQIIGLMAMIICAWYWRSVWTLLVSGFVSGSLKTFFSHILFPSPTMSLSWIMEDVKEIINFGKWIFLSSIGGFLVLRLDRIVLGLYLTTTEFGLYGVALAIPMAILDLIQTLSQKVLIPIYAHLKENSLKTLREQTYNVRAALMALGFVPMFIMIIWGQAIINFLYPVNYHGAGWMLQILAVSGCFKCITSTINPILVAVGNTYRSMLLIITYAILMIVCMFTGGYYFGNTGVIWALSACELLIYPIIILSIKRYGVWLPSLDLVGFLLTLVVMLIEGLL